MPPGNLQRAIKVIEWNFMERAPSGRYEGEAHITDEIRAQILLNSRFSWVDRRLGVRGPNGGDWVPDITYKVRKYQRDPKQSITIACEVKLINYPIDRGAENAQLARGFGQCGLSEVVLG